MTKKILIADDEKNMVWALQKALKNEEFKIVTAYDGDEAVKKVEAEIPDLVILDYKMPKLDGLEALKKMKMLYPNISIIMMTAHGTMESAVEAMKNGAIDYVSKPFDIDELKIQIRKALDIENMKEQIEFLTEEIKNRTGKTIIGESSKVKDVLNIVSRVSKSNATVLITGDSGTGKELIANAIHYNSDRNRKPYVKINCGAIPENLIESELFGHEKGAFTGAISKKRGKFERANFGTIFLDEIGELSLSMQVKLLRVLQEKEIERVGGSEVIQIDVRIVAATNKNLEKMVEEESFREDLYYRLNVIPIKLPSLKERKEDIPLLASYFIDKYCKELGRDPISIDDEALQILVNYEWKGNIRELENIIERMIILSSGNTIYKKDLPKEILLPNFEAEKFILPEDGINLEEVEKDFIIQAMSMSSGNQTKAAKLLGISRHTLLYRLEKYKI